MFTLTSFEPFYSQYEGLFNLLDSSGQNSGLLTYPNLNSFFRALHSKGCNQGTICIVDSDTNTYAIDITNGGPGIIACAYLTERK